MATSVTDPITGVTTTSKARKLSNSHQVTSHNMGRQEKTDKRQEHDANEKKAILLQKAEQAGLLFQETELPPEEVDEKEVSKSLVTTILTMIPYTQAWYESRAAEDEMDNLSRIRIERAKAEDLLAMSKMGRHEEALSKLLAETNNDFFYFNKLRTKLEAEGKFTVEQKDLNPFASLSKGKNRNRIKKALGKHFSLIDSSKMSINVGNMKEAVESVTKRPRKDAPCTWRGKDKAGEWLQCTSLRMPHLTKTYKDEKGETCPELLAFCCYHLQDCPNHSEETAVKIKIPNSEGLCQECFFFKKKTKPPGMTLESCPGVGPVTLLGPSKLVEAEETDHTVLALTEKSICCWRPHGENEVHLRYYECKNTVLLNSETGIFVRTCGMHVLHCLRNHPSGNDVITIPNIHGLCVMHHTSELGYAPVPVDFPFPGLTLKVNKNAWKIQPGHWAAPNWSPYEDMEAAVYEAPEKHTDLVSQVFAAVHDISVWWRIRKHGEKASIKIQTFYRRYRVKGLHLEMKFRQTALRRRLPAIIRIQAQMRRYLCSSYMHGRRENFKLSTVVIQRHFRGYWCRLKLREQWAARRIQKFMKLLHFFRFKDSVIMVMQLRRIFMRRFLAVVNIQRVFRGYSDRCALFRMAMWKFLSKRNSKIIQRAYRVHLLWVHRVIKVSPGEDWAREQCGKIIARLLYKLYLVWKQKKNTQTLMAKCAPRVQRMLRGYMTRTSTFKMKMLRESLRNWCEPHFATDFLKSFLESKVFYLKDGKKQLLVLDRPATVRKCVYVRKYLTAEDARSYDVHIKTASAALAQWYEAELTPLLISERDALLHTFKNPATGNIVMAELDEYIDMHKLPCRKHGRKICGACYCLRDCRIKKCSCRTFGFNGRLGGVCVGCNHPPSLHRKCPTQINEDNTSAPSLSNILTSIREPDMSRSEHVTGVQMLEVLQSPPNPDDQRSVLLQTMIRTSLQKTQTIVNSMTMLKTLSFCQVCGDKVMNESDYWQLTAQSHVSMTKSNEEALLAVNVATHKVIPNYNISEELFWSSAGKNPNKRVRDYNEKFDHNMPVPLVENGELKYTLEGPKVYLNLLIQIVMMENTVGFDNPDFLQLVVNNIQLFERHWRKMVADIRVGKLNRNLEVTDDTRLLYENTNVPRPELSNRLDSIFRKLGFHKKVLGKDIVIQKYAELRHRTVVNPRARRPSLPRLNKTPLTSLTAAGGEDSLAMTRQFSRTATAASNLATTQPRVNFASPLRSSLSSLPPANKLLVSTSFSSAAGSPSRSGAPALSPITMDTSLDDRNKLTSPSKTKRSQLEAISSAIKSDGLAKLRQDEMEQTVRGPSRRSRRDKRRGSDTDILRPATTAELHAINYKQETAARATYHMAIEMQGNRYLCPFPACGQSFRSKDAAFAHLPDHEQRARLHAPTPLPDSHMHYYWPEGVPWLTAPKFVERSVPPGSIACPFEGCKVVLPNKERLDAHIRLVHSQTGPSCVLRGYFKMEGACVSVPPFDPPAEAPIRFCPHHVLPVGRCPLCVELEIGTTNPKPPFKFYDAVSINFAAKDELSMAQVQATGGLASKETEIRFSHNETAFGVEFKAVESGMSMKGVPIAMLIDRNQDGWVAVQQLLGPLEAQARSYDLPDDFDRNFELVYIKSDKLLFRWIPICTIVRRFHMLYLSRQEFKDKQQAKQLPKGRLFFVRI